MSISALAISPASLQDTIEATVSPPIALFLVPFPVKHGAPAILTQQNKLAQGQSNPRARRYARRRGSLPPRFTGVVVSLQSLAVTFWAGLVLLQSLAVTFWAIWSQKEFLHVTFFFRIRHHFGHAPLL
jgi:hypothetical protein